MRTSMISLLLFFACQQENPDYGPYPAVVGDASRVEDDGWMLIEDGTVYMEDLFVVDATKCCPLFMRFANGYCIDEQPALIQNGKQGTALTWPDADATCRRRGGRLCTIIERESACMQDANRFCSGPANTWEWSDDVCQNWHANSACCNTANGTKNVQCGDSRWAASYHCCADTNCGG